jgi:hypothetical protein
VKTETLILQSLPIKDPGVLVMKNLFRLQTKTHFSVNKPNILLKDKAKNSGPLSFLTITLPEDKLLNKLSQLLSLKAKMLMKSLLQLKHLWMLNLILNLFLFLKKLFSIILNLDNIKNSKIYL